MNPAPGRGAAPAAAIGVGLGLAVAVLIAGVRRVVVEGSSMEPGLVCGDRLLVVRTRSPRVGDIVALADPRRPSRLLIKRVVGRRADEFVVEGDNPQASTDSRLFGPVPWAAIRGRAVYRYAPVGRSGRLR